MKKYVILIATGLLCMTACNEGKLKIAEARNVQLDDSLQTALANQDSLFIPNWKKSCQHRNNTAQP